MAKRSPKTRRPVGMQASSEPEPAALLQELRSMVHEARRTVAHAVNVSTVALYWKIGERIRREILGQERAEYGERIVATVSQQLKAEFGGGFSRYSVYRMIRFAELFPDAEIVATLSRQLSWSHFIEIIVLDDPLKRDFYAEMCRAEGWSVRILRQKIGSMLYERTALARKPEDVIRNDIDTLRAEDRMTPDLVFRDPYVLDFLGLSGAHSERDMESAILREMESFLLELGAGFAFVGRQKRITVDNEDYYLDLLFYHRGLQRLVAVELKLGRFKAADKGQMELYLRWLDRYERRAGEESPLGLILCAGKTTEHVELLQLEESGIRVAEYLTALPPRDVLQHKLHEAIRLAREQIATRRLSQRAGGDEE